MDKRARALSYGPTVLLVLLGIAAAVAFSGTVGQLLAIILIGLGLIGAVALVFYEVGLSEDRERAREEAAREATRRQREVGVRPPNPRFRGAGRSHRRRR